jgi:ribonucleoside-diphosphate reductase alpha chain
VRFEPSGYTKNPEIRIAKSIVDYVFRWLATKFLPVEAQINAGVNRKEPVDESAAQSAKPASKTNGSAGHGAMPTSAPHAAIQNQEDAPPCSTCGAIMVRSGSCYKCANCGNTSGCA